MDVSKTCKKHCTKYSLKRTLLAINKLHFAFHVCICRAKHGYLNPHHPVNVLDVALNVLLVRGGGTTYLVLYSGTYRFYISMEKTSPVNSLNRL